MEYNEKFIDLLKDNQLRQHLLIKDFKSIYKMLPQDCIGMFTEFCFDTLKINPLEYMTEIPNCFLTGTSINHLVIPDNVTVIGEWALKNCKNLTSVVIGDGVTTIGERAFDDCSGLTSVIIGNSVTTIGDWAFHDCTSLTSVTIGNSVTTIGRSAFYDCVSLTSIEIPNGVTTIGDAAFMYCYNLTNIVLGNNVTTIGYDVFYNCHKLKSIKYLGTKKEARIKLKGKNKKWIGAWLSNISKIICTDGEIEL